MIPLLQEIAQAENIYRIKGHIYIKYLQQHLDMSEECPCHLKIL